MRERSIAEASAPTSAPGTRSRSASSASRTGAPHSICATAEPSSAASGPLVPFEISENTVAGERPDAAPTASMSSASGSASTKRSARRRARRSSSASGARNPAATSRAPATSPSRVGSTGATPSPRDSPGEGPAELRRHDRARLERSGETGARDPLREPQASRSAGERLAAGAAESPAGAFAQRSGELPDRAEEEEDRDRRERRRHRTVTRLRRRIAANPAS